MKPNQLGIKVKFYQYGSFDKRIVGSTHEVKSLAGTMFHSPEVKSVCVYTHRGEVPLYLNKTPNGVVREENK